MINTPRHACSKKSSVERQADLIKKVKLRKQKEEAKRRRLEEEKKQESEDEPEDACMDVLGALMAGTTGNSNDDDEPSCHQHGLLTDAQQVVSAAGRAHADACNACRPRAQLFDVT